MTLEDLLTVERVVPRLCAHDRQDALRKLVSHFSNDARVAKRDVKDALMRSVEFYHLWTWQRRLCRML